MAESARNAFLKLLEEPPTDLEIILLTTKRGSIMPTILSRVRTYSFIDRSVEQEKEVLNRVFHYSQEESSGLKSFFYSYLPVSLKDIEKEFKRERIIRWGPRTLDLDLIDFNGEISNDSFITLPHPRAYQRAFVLVPANEIAPDLLLGGKYSIQHYLKNLSENDIKGITKLNYAQ